MAYEMLMPDLGGGQTTARVERWFCEEGYSVREGDEVVCLATPTTEMRLPSPMTGVIKEILVDEGDEVSVGDVLALLE